MYIFLDAITFRYRGAPAPVLNRLSLFVRLGEIAAVVDPADAGKTTLLRYVGRRSDGQGRVFLGSEADESGRKPGLIRGWRFCMGDDAFPPEWGSERWRGVWIRRYAFPTMALDGSDREPPDGWSEEADNVFFSIYSKDGTVRDTGWDGAAPNDPDRQDLLLVDDLSTRLRFGDAANRCAFIRDLHPMPRRRTVIYATRDPADALEVVESDRGPAAGPNRAVWDAVRDTPRTRQQVRGAALPVRRCTRRSTHGFEGPVDSRCKRGSRYPCRRFPRCSSTSGSRPWRTGAGPRSETGRLRRPTTRARSSRRRCRTSSRTRSMGGRLHPTASQCAKVDVP